MKLFIATGYFSLFLVCCGDPAKKISMQNSVADDTMPAIDSFFIQKAFTDTSNGWFFWTGALNADTMVLSKTNMDSGNDLLQFKEDGTIRHEDYFNGVRCGNGILWMDSTSTWKVKNDRLTLNLTYGYSMTFAKFHSKMEYKIDSSVPGKHILASERFILRNRNTKFYRFF